MERSENTVKTNTSHIITPEEVVKDFNAHFLDESFCIQYILDKLHPRSTQCPHCKQDIKDDTTLDNFFAAKRCQCKSCKRWFTATTGTFLQGSQLNARQIVLLMLLLGYQINNRDIARILSVHPDTVSLWQKKINALKDINANI